MTGTIALFVGGDITAHLLAQGVVRVLAREGVSFLLVYPEQVIPGTNVRPGYEEFYYLERALFHEQVFNVTDQSDHWNLNKSLTPVGLCRSFPHHVKRLRVSDVNSSNFVELLRQAGVHIGVSLRWYQKFGDKMLKYFSEKDAIGARRLLNYHPGILPKYRGVITFIRALAAGDTMAGFTLHDVDARWDAGPVLCYSMHRLESRLSVLGNMCAHVPSATNVLIEALRTLCTGQNIHPIAQDEKNSVYFTFPTLEELFALQLRGIQLASLSDVRSIISEHFGSALEVVRNLESKSIDFLT